MSLTALQFLRMLLVVVVVVFVSSVSAETSTSPSSSSQFVVSSILNDKTRRLSTSRLVSESYPSQRRTRLSDNTDVGETMIRNLQQKQQQQQQRQLQDDGDDDASSKHKSDPEEDEVNSDSQTIVDSRTENGLQQGDISGTNAGRRHIITSTVLLSLSATAVAVAVAMAVTTF